MTRSRTARTLFCIAFAATIVGAHVGVAAAQSKDQIEAAAQYERGLVFYKQGAYAEAEQALRQAERKDGRNIQYQLATADVYVKLHKPDEAMKRYSKIYKDDPTNQRALAGMAATYEEMQNYREAARMWMRYTKMEIAPDQQAEVASRLRAAQALFAEHYEIAENPAGGAANAASLAQERQWGLEFAKQITDSGIPLVSDAEITAYVKGLCEAIVPFAKGFPREYQLFVLDSPTVNAQTTPGFIFVYRGILETVGSEAELAGVLAHEMGHSIAHHAGKAVTKAAQNQQTLAALQSQGGGLAKVLTGLLAIGNPLGELSFSREQEAQADRLGIHVAYDAGYDPRALAALFQKFEAMAPSSRKGWDLMTRTHPFSIDRMNAVNDYVPLLPDRSFKTSSPAFERMKARLSALPPPPAPAPAPADSLAPPGGGGAVPFSVENAPFTGMRPAAWVSRTDQGTLVFEGQQGTEAYDATVQLEAVAHTSLTGKSLDDVAQIVVNDIREKPAAQVQPPQARTSGGLRASAIQATYSLQMNNRTVPFRHLSVVIDYPEHFVVLSYFAPEMLFDKYLPMYQQIGESLQYTGR